MIPVLVKSRSACAVAPAAAILRTRLTTIWFVFLGFASPRSNCRRIGFCDFDFFVETDHFSRPFCTLIV